MIGCVGFVYRFNQLVNGRVYIAEIMPKAVKSTLRYFSTVADSFGVDACFFFRKRPV